MIEGHERAPAHDRVAALVDAAAARASGELRVLAGCEELVTLAGELRQLLDDDGARGHVDTEREGLGREHDLHEPGGEGLLDRLLHRGHHARMVRGEARLETGEPLVVAQDVEVGVGEGRGAHLGDLPDGLAFVGLGEAQSRGETLLDRLVAAVATEDERDRGEHVLVGEELDRLDPARRAEA